MLSGVPRSPTQKAFSLADPAVAERVLVDAGFGEVRVVDVREPVYYGADPQAACEAIRGLQIGQDLLEGLNQAQVDQAYRRLLDVLACSRQRGRCLVRLPGVDHHRGKALTELAAAARQVLGELPVWRLKARLKASSDS